MKLLLLTIILLAPLINMVLAEAKSDISIGQSFSISSKYLKGEREFFVNLPKDYATSDKAYPVLYILDGQMHFTSAVAIQHSINGEIEIPEMIIVGIQNVYPQRRDMQWSKRELFASYLSAELIPLIEKKYRSNSERLIFGWEMGGIFSTYLLFHKSQLFNGAIASNGVYADIEMLTEFAEIKAKSAKYLYVVNSIKDIYSLDRSKDLNILLTDNPPKNLNWKSEWFNDETHSSLPYLAMFHGLRDYYHNFNAYDFYSIEQFEKFGGIPAIQEFFKERGKRFGFSQEIDDSTKNTLIWLSWKRDNYKYFSFFMTEFNDVLATKRYQSNYWQNRFAQFYLKHKNYDRAEYHFNYAVKQFSGTAEIYNGLGEVYLAQEMIDKAIVNFKKAVELAEKKSDEDLPTYLTNYQEAKALDSE